MQLLTKNHLFFWKSLQAKWFSIFPLLLLSCAIQSSGIEDNTCIVLRDMDTLIQSIAGLDRNVNIGDQTIKTQKEALTSIFQIWMQTTKKKEPIMKPDKIKDFLKKKEIKDSLAKAWNEDPFSSISDDSLNAALHCYRLILMMQFRWLQTYYIPAMNKIFWEELFKFQEYKKLYEDFTNQKEAYQENLVKKFSEDNLNAIKQFIINKFGFEERIINVNMLLQDESSKKKESILRSFLDDNEVLKQSFFIDYQRDQLAIFLAKLDLEENRLKILKPLEEDITILKGGDAASDKLLSKNLLPTLPELPAFKEVLKTINQEVKKDHSFFAIWGKIYTSSKLDNIFSIKDQVTLLEQAKKAIQELENSIKNFMENSFYLDRNKNYPTNPRLAQKAAARKAIKDNPYCKEFVKAAKDLEKVSEDLLPLDDNQFKKWQEDTIQPLLHVLQSMIDKHIRPLAQSKTKMVDQLIYWQKIFYVMQIMPTWIKNYKAWDDQKAVWEVDLAQLINPEGYDITKETYRDITQFIFLLQLYPNIIDAESKANKWRELLKTKDPKARQKLVRFMKKLKDGLDPFLSKEHSLIDKQLLYITKTATEETKKLKEQFEDINKVIDDYFEQLKSESSITESVSDQVLYEYINQQYPEDSPSFSHDGWLEVFEQKIKCQLIIYRLNRNLSDKKEFDELLMNNDQIAAIIKWIKGDSNNQVRDALSQQKALATLYLTSLLVSQTDYIKEQTIKNSVEELQKKITTQYESRKEAEKKHKVTMTQLVEKVKKVIEKYESNNTSDQENIQSAIDEVKNDIQSALHNKSEAEKKEIANALANDLLSLLYKANQQQGMTKLMHYLSLVSLFELLRNYYPNNHQLSVNNVWEKVIAPFVNEKVDTYLSEQHIESCVNNEILAQETKKFLEQIRNFPKRLWENSTKINDSLSQWSNIENSLKNRKHEALPQPGESGAQINLTQDLVSKNEDEGRSPESNSIMKSILMASLVLAVIVIVALGITKLLRYLMNQQQTKKIK